MKIEINLIKIQPGHPAFQHEPVKNLLNKRNSSQQKPIVLKDKNGYLLYSGEKVLRNAKKNNKSKIDCNVKEKIEDLPSINLSEIYFSGLKPPTEVAKEFISFRKKNNISQQELSRRTGITPGTIHHYESLIKKLNPQLLKALDNGNLTFKEARCIADIDDFELQYEISKPFISGEISSVYVEKIIGNIKKNPKTPIEKIFKSVVNGNEIKPVVKKQNEIINNELKELSIEEKILHFAIELDSVKGEEIPEYRRLRVISTLKILDSKIKSTLNHMNGSFAEKTKVYINSK
ncbi:MAG: hypothetical protein CL773_05600 [Chloroflexi bacterium]|nr:hypothetical protein [Chloroflexota bacterium]|tara:strand:+ start:2300 stop:3169 length:870 start_codon:yes stop_codon:yes gene_type:complete